MNPHERYQLKITMKVFWIIVPLGFLEWVSAVNRKSLCDREIKFGAKKIFCPHEIQEIWSYRGGDSCHNWFYGGCREIISNNFPSAKECHDACVTSGVGFASRAQHYCALPHNLPPSFFMDDCPSKMVWTYDPRIDECTSWSFSGCMREGNVYVSYADCQNHCVKARSSVHWYKENEECLRVVPDIRPNSACTSHIWMWIYDSVDNKCKPRHIQAYTLPKNTFRTLSECEDKCVAKEEWNEPNRFIALCELQIDPKPKKTKCGQGTTVYSYDRFSDICEKWTYLGCEIAGNYYQTHVDCQRSCVRKFGVTRNWA